MNAASRERRLVFAIPGDIDTRSGGYGYDRRMIEELRAIGWTVEHLQLPGGFPEPSESELAETAEKLAALAADSLVLIDGLAFGAMPAIAMQEATRLRMIALVHHPLALESGIPAGVAERLRKSEMTALGAAKGVVVTSPSTARTLLSQFRVAPDLVRVAVPGTEQAKPASGSTAGDGVIILSVGSLTQRKDHAALISALERISDRPWQCRIAGSDDMDRQCAADLRRQIEACGLSDRVTLTGALDDVAVEYAQADIFALASQYEGYGMAFAEAMVRGLPIVGCRGGAIPDLVTDDAGILVEPGDIAGLAEALALLIDQPETRQAYSAGALAVGQQLPDWPATAKVLSDFLEEMR